MIRLGLKVAPMEGLWWYRQYELSRRLGHGPAADQSLAVALTGGPGDPTLVAAAWEIDQARRAALPAAIP
jgi:hypothetical protein